ncbi:hypothetical protein MTO96_004890 [Rhipicephalus appendiculatus]
MSEMSNGEMTFSSRPARRLQGKVRWCGQVKGADSLGSLPGASRCDCERKNERAEARNCREQQQLLCECSTARGGRTVARAVALARENELRERDDDSLKL